MKLTYFQGKVPNFGDELNAHVWQHLLPPGLLDDDAAELFLGIGSILWDHLPKAPRKFVVGSGYGGYTGVPDVHDGTWEVVFVRGPRTASALGLPAGKAITDGAVLLRAVPLPEPAPGIDVAFMPHFESLGRGDWREVCRLAGIHLIDPTGPVDTILSQLRGARLLLTEAMHGAIVADALRTPWVAVTPIHKDHHFKWHDWTESLGLSYRPERLLPSSLMEAWTKRTGSEGTGWKGRFIGGALSLPLDPGLRHLAARHLRGLARKDPQLSTDAAIGRATERAQDALDGFVRARARLVA